MLGLHEELSCRVFVRTRSGNGLECRIRLGWALASLRGTDDDPEEYGLRDVCRKS